MLTSLVFLQQGNVKKFKKLTGSILESKGMRAIFRKKGKKGQKHVKKWQKRAKHLKIWAKIYKI